jgi:hypothetical protein
MIVAQISIMESLQLVMEPKMVLITSSLRTHGVIHGEIKDMSKSDKTTHAEFSRVLSILLRDA